MRLVLLLLAAVGLAACATQAPTDLTPRSDIVKFSDSRPGAKLPRGWHGWIITRAKSPTRYDLVTDPLTQQVVLHAVADGAATGLQQRLSVDPIARPTIAWQWRVVELIHGADNTDRDAEDSPARLLLFFDGDTTRLPARDQVMMDTARMLTGQAVPYATLMYIWENHQPIDTVIPNRLTNRVKMVVAGTGKTRLGQWKQFERNYVDDFERAFGEAPGRLIGIGILTDTDNTGSKVEAFYGDIELRPVAQAAARP